MGKLLYVTNVSLDGFIEDEHGGFAFTEPDDEQFAFVTELVRPAATFLYGRRLYEAMSVWETEPALAADSELRADFARMWQAAEKIVYSTTLDAVPTARTRVERAFEPDAVRALTAATAHDLTIGGAELAASAFAAGVVDEVHLFVAPVGLGRGKRGLPEDRRVELELLDERRFDNGVLYVRYAVRA